MKRTKNIKISGDLYMEAYCTIVVGLLSPPSGSKGHYINTATLIILVCDCLTMHLIKKCKILPTIMERLFFNQWHKHVSNAEDKKDGSSLRKTIILWTLSTDREDLYHQAFQALRLWLRGYRTDPWEAAAPPRRRHQRHNYLIFRRKCWVGVNRRKVKLCASADAERAVTRGHWRRLGLSITTGRHNIFL